MNTAAPSSSAQSKLPNPVRIFVVDDHPIFSDVIAEVLNDAPDFTVVGTARDGESALALMGNVQVDVLMLDLVLPSLSGLEVLEAVRARNPELKTVICSGVTTDEVIVAAFAAGVNAIVEKTSNVEELLQTLRTVARGDYPMNTRLNDVLRAVVQQRLTTKPLSASDLQILRRLANGLGVKEVASELGISASGVYKARTRIAARLAIAKPNGLSSAAARLGLVPRMPERDGRVPGSERPVLS
jgi:DNA-binding NarL/FixJ family response regulator